MSAEEVEDAIMKVRSIIETTKTWMAQLPVEPTRQWAEAIGFLDTIPPAFQYAMANKDKISGIYSNNQQYTGGQFGGAQQTFAALAGLTGPQMMGGYGQQYAGGQGYFPAAQPYGANPQMMGQPYGQQQIMGQPQYAGGQFGTNPQMTQNFGNQQMMPGQMWGGNQNDRPIGVVDPQAGGPAPMVNQAQTMTAGPTVPAPQANVPPAAPAEEHKPTKTFKA
jgi:Ca2+-binding RTX toxin-like protein